MSSSDNCSIIPDIPSSQPVSSFSFPLHFSISIDLSFNPSCQRIILASFLANMSFLVDILFSETTVFSPVSLSGASGGSDSPALTTSSQTCSSEIFIFLETSLAKWACSILLPSLAMRGRTVLEISILIFLSSSPEEITLSI